MNRQEAVTLTRLVKAACPAQAIDEYTPNAWHPLLDDLVFDDCTAALRILGRQKEFISPADIRAQVQRIRNDRIERAFIPPPPAELADNPQAYKRALAENVRKAADGELPAAGPAPLAITGTPEAERKHRQPASLAQTVGELRKQIGAARLQSRPVGPEQAAAQQAAESRAEREGTEDGEAGDAA